MSGGAGLGPAGLFSAGASYAPGGATERATLVSSRLIDADGRVVQTADGTGGYEGMNDTAQRVYLLVMSVERPAKMGPDFARKYEQAIRDALLVVTDGATPAAEVMSIDIPTRGDLATPRVVFRDLLDGGRVKTFPQT